MKIVDRLQQDIADAQSKRDYRLSKAEPLKAGRRKAQHLWNARFHSGVARGIQIALDRIA